VRLLLLHPELPSCQECQTKVYDPTNGWRPAERGGKPCLREPGTPTPCGVCPKIPRGQQPHPSNAIELTDAHYRAFVHYQRCKATGRFPADRIVERNAGILRTVEEQVAREEQGRLLTGVVAAVQAAVLTRGMR
jgi:hypothetical protein